MEERIVVVKSGSFRSFLMGAIMGAGIALLFAPFAGKETRALISDKSLELKDQATGIAKDTREKAQTAYISARNKVKETVKSAKERTQNNRDVDELKRELEIMEDVNNPSFPL